MSIGNMTNEITNEKRGGDKKRNGKYMQGVYYS